MTDRPFIGLPGVIYSVGDPEFFGRHPVRTELTVLPPDEATTPLGWTLKSYTGSEVFLLDEGGQTIEKGSYESRGHQGGGVDLCSYVGRWLDSPGLS